MEQKNKTEEYASVRKNFKPIYVLDENVRTLISVVNKFKSIASATGGSVDPRAIKAEKEIDAVLGTVGTINLYCEGVIKSLGNDESEGLH